jgi:hypothetical protein
MTAARATWQDANQNEAKLKAYFALPFTVTWALRAVCACRQNAECFSHLSTGLKTYHSRLTSKAKAKGTAKVLTCCVLRPRPRLRALFQAPGRLIFRTDRRIFIGAYFQSASQGHCQLCQSQAPGALEGVEDIKKKKSRAGTGTLALALEIDRKIAGQGTAGRGNL